LPPPPFFSFPCISTAAIFPFFSPLSFSLLSRTGRSASPLSDECLSRAWPTPDRPFSPFLLPSQGKKDVLPPSGKRALPALQVDGDFFRLFETPFSLPPPEGSWRLFFLPRSSYREPFCRCSSFPFFSSFLNRELKPGRPPFSFPPIPSGGKPINTVSFSSSLIEGVRVPYLAFPRYFVLCGSRPFPLFFPFCRGEMELVEWVLKRRVLCQGW